MVGLRYLCRGAGEALGHQRGHRRAPALPGRWLRRLLTPRGRRFEHRLPASYPCAVSAGGCASWPPSLLDHVDAAW